MTVGPHSLDANAQEMTFSTGSNHNTGKKWNVFKRAFFSKLSLERGFNGLSLGFTSLDEWGLEVRLVMVDKLYMLNLKAYFSTHLTLLLSFLFIA